MKKLNKRKKVLLWGSAIFVVGLVALYFAGTAVIAYRAEHRRADGIAASKAGDHPRAAELLGRYLHRFPRDKYPGDRSPGGLDALSYYVVSREKAELPNGQHFADTINALKVLIGIDPDRLDDQRHLLELYAKLQRGPEALDTANAILTNLERRKLPPDERTLELKTDVLRKLRRTREALETATEWTTAFPQSLRGHIARLSLQVELKVSPQTILADATRLQQAHPDDPQFKLLMGFAYAVAGDVKQAAEWLKRSENNPKMTDEFVDVLTDQYDIIGQPAESMRVLETRAAQGGGVELKHTLARRYWEMGKWPEALKYYGDVKAEDPGVDATLLALKAVALAKSEQMPESRACRAALERRDQPTAAAWTVLLKNMLDGAKIDDQTIITVCKAALINDSKNAFLLFYYADANARQGEMDIAIPFFAQAMKADPTWGVPALRLVESLLQRGHPDQAMEVASSVVKRNPNNANAVIMLARAWSAGVEAGNVGKEDQLLRLVTEVQKQLPTEVQTRVIRIELLAGQGKKDEATALLREALAFKPAPPEQMYLTLANDSRKYDLGVSAECFAACEKAHGVTSLLAFTRAIDQLATTKDGNEALKVFDEMAARGIDANGAPWRLDRARLLDAANDPHAKAAWIAVRDAFPKDASVQQAIVSTRSLQGDWEALHPAIENLHAATGDKSLGWRLADAKLLLDSPRGEEDYDKASLALQVLSTEYPRLAEPRVLLARGLVHLNRIDGAIDQLSTASDADPANVQIGLQLAGLLQSRGDFDRVQQELDRLTPFIHSSTQRRQVAAMFTSVGESDRAMQVLEGKSTTKPSGAQGPDRSEELMRAMIHRRRHEYDQAEAILKPLLEKPDISVVQVAASLYVAEGKNAEADKVLKLLDTMKLEPGTKEMAWGSVFAQAGAPGFAIPHYRMATQQAPTNSAAWRSLVVSELSAGATDIIPADIAAAAKAVPSDKAFAELHDEKHGSLVKFAIADPKLKGVLVSVIRDPSAAGTAFELIGDVEQSRHTLDRERLAGQLQQMIEKQPNYLPAQIQLVQCLISMGRVQEAIAAAQRATAAFPTDADPAKLAVQIAAASGRWDDVIPSAQAWKRRASEEAQAADTAIARAKLAQGAYEESLSTLTPYLAAAQKEPGKNFDFIGAYSLALLKAGRVDEAKAILWPLVSTDEAWRVLWVQVGEEGLQGNSKLKDWFEQLESLGSTLGVSSRVALAEGYERVGRATSDKSMTQHSNDLFAVVVKDEKVSPTVMAVAAAHAERMEDYKLAESLYRLSLARNPNAVVIQNNLAMLIVNRGGDAAEATKLAAAAVAAAPESATLRDTYAQAVSKLGKPAEAVQAMKQASALEPDNVMWRIRLGHYQLMAGDRAGATKTLQQIDDTTSDISALPTQTRSELGSLRDMVKTDKG